MYYSGLQRNKDDGVPILDVSRPSLEEQVAGNQNLVIIR